MAAAKWDALIQNLDQAVREVLAYFLYFHDATAWGIQSAAFGGPVWAPDLDAPCFRRANGETLTGAQRLDLLAKHWREHVQELQAAETR